MEIIKAIVLGVVQGITEWLPISSTGHMILVDEFMKLNVSSEFMEMFLVVIQLGSIMAVVVLYFYKLNPFSLRKTKAERMDTVSLWMKVVVACVPAGVIGLKFNDEIDKIFYNYQTVSITLILYGLLFIIIENMNKKRRPRIESLKDLTYLTVLLIGVFQVLALIPGTSRSGATIVGAILLGTSRYVAAEFSFFLAVPVMFGASFVKIMKFGLSFNGEELAILISAMATAFVISILAIKFLMGYIKNHDFKVFGYYRIILGAIVLVYFIFAG